jgi:hypothetical protein
MNFTRISVKKSTPKAVKEILATRGNESVEYYFAGVSGNPHVYSTKIIHAAHIYILKREI